MLKKTRNKTQNTEISESNLLKIQILVPKHETRNPTNHSLPRGTTASGARTRSAVGPKSACFVRHARVAKTSPRPTSAVRSWSNGCGYARETPSARRVHAERRPTERRFPFWEGDVAQSQPSVLFLF